MKASGLISKPDQEMLLLKRTIKILVQSSYFNHKSFGEEMLIEEYGIELSLK